MLVLGLVLIAVAVAVGAGAVFDGSEAASVELLGTTVDTTVAGVFFAGTATMLVFMLGVLMLVSSMGRARRKRQDRKEAKRRQRDSVRALEEERAQLRAENERLSGQLGDARAPEDTRTADETRTTDTRTTDTRTTDDTRTTGRHDRTAIDRDRDGTPDAVESSGRGAPLREGDGPTSTRRDDTSIDVREQERTTTGRYTTRA
jgi:hypothetical protein